MPTQAEMFEQVTGGRPPSTRYQGSKLKLLPWIWENLSPLRFQSVLDAFGGTAAVSYMLKAKGKEVTYNDYLRSNYLSAVALVENDSRRISDTCLPALYERHSKLAYDDVISRNFSGIYFTDDENTWLDVTVQNIMRIEDVYQRSLCFHALFQSCIIKRPYNLFHRKNLYMRTAEVARGFGNKATWDTPFADHFKTFVAEANEAIFSSGKRCRATLGDAFEVSGEYDLVYIDTPYVNANGVVVDYLGFYHFLEGLADYSNWEGGIDFTRKHRPLLGPRSAWSNVHTVRNAFRRLFRKFGDSTLVISYRSDGIPSEAEMVRLLREVKHNVSVVHFGEYKYVLSKNDGSKEILFIAE